MSCSWGISSWKIWSYGKEVWKGESGSQKCFINVACCWIFGNHNPNFSLPDNQEQSWEQQKLCFKGPLGVPSIATITAWKVMVPSDLSNIYSFVWNLSCAVESTQLFREKLGRKWCMQLNVSRMDCGNNSALQQLHKHWCPTNFQVLSKAICDSENV